MSEQELIEVMRTIKNNLENVKSNLRNASSILNSSITFNNERFKNNEIDVINFKLNTQINNINNKIIPKLNSM